MGKMPANYSVTIFDVFKVILRESNENDALQAVAAIRKGTKEAL
jgi:hypothetical protein